MAPVVTNFRRTLLIVLALTAHSAHAWQVHLGGPNFDEATTVAVDPSGNVVAGGYFDGETAAGARAVVVSLARSGRERWRYEVGDHRSVVYRLAIDDAGDVFVEGGENGRLMATKLDGRTGAVRWRDGMRFDYTDGGIALVPGGDVMLGGFVEGVDEFGDVEPHGVLRRLSGADGAEQWRVLGPGRVVLADATGVYTDERLTPMAKRSLVDGSVLWIASEGIGWYNAVGDGAGDLVGFGASEQSIAKVSGADGTTRWVRSLGADGLALGSPPDLAVDAAGNVIVAGSTVSTADGRADVLVYKLRGDDGTTMWRFTFDGDGPLNHGGTTRVIVDRAGNVVVAPRMGRHGDFTGSEVAVLSIRGTDGTLRWFQHIPGQFGGTPWALAIGRNGFVAVAGHLYDGHGRDFFVARLSARSGRGAARVR
jgi:outer membrane protein assembly factor BamB